jgi:glycerophosphoryl diester phosphodiesterase
VTLELKVAAAADRAVDAIGMADAFAWTAVRSPDLDRLAALRKAEPRLKTGAMAPLPAPADRDAFLARLKAAGVTAWTPGSNEKLTREDVAATRAAGIVVWATLANDADQMRRLAALGVDGIITDKPELLIQVLDGAP